MQPQSRLSFLLTRTDTHCITRFSIPRHAMPNDSILVVQSTPSFLQLSSTVAMLCVTNLAIGFGIGYAIGALRKIQITRPEQQPLLARDTPRALPPRPDEPPLQHDQESAVASSAAIRITQLVVYPIKACAGVAVSSARVTSRGLQNDRLYMVVDFTGRNLTQKKFPALTLVKPFVNDDGVLVVEAPGMKTLYHTAKTYGKSMEVVACTAKCQAIDQGDEAAQFFSTYLELAGVRLVRMKDNFVRAVGGRHVPPDTYQASFADEYPYLLASVASLRDLSSKSGRELDMRQFRPNVVVDADDGHLDAWAEDAWKTIAVGENCRFEIPKPCIRCKVVTVDPDSGVFDEQNEPTMTLKKYRSFRKTVVFGQNMVPVVHGKRHVLSVGDCLSIEELFENVPQPDSSADTA